MVDADFSDDERWMRATDTAAGDGKLRSPG
jgi:hypothetical protein